MLASWEEGSYIWYFLAAVFTSMQVVKDGKCHQNLMDWNETVCIHICIGRAAKAFILLAALRKAG